MNETEIARIAAAVNQLRPDWPTASLRTILNGDQLKDRPRRDVAVALTWVACELESKTPARVLESGPWWVAATVERPESDRWMPPKADDACHIHPGEYRHRCRACVADKLAGDPTPRRRERVERVDGHLEQLRHLKDAATIANCRHGVARSKCADCVNGDHPEPPPLTRPQDRLREPEPSSEEVAP